MCALRGEVQPLCSNVRAARLSGMSSISSGSGGGGGVKHTHNSCDLVYLLGVLHPTSTPRTYTRSQELCL